MRDTIEAELGNTECIVVERGGGGRERGGEREGGRDRDRNGERKTEKQRQTKRETEGELNRKRTGTTILILCSPFLRSVINNK